MPGDRTHLRDAIIATVFAFFRIHGLAGLLLVPYAAWVTIAAVLNLTL